MAHSPELGPPHPRTGPSAFERDCANAGVHVIVGTVVDLSGVIRAKAVAPARLARFRSPGLGASPAWHVFTSDNSIAFTPSLHVVGDHRLRLDIAAGQVLDSALAWAPAQFHNQDGTPSPWCARGLLRRLAGELEARGLGALLGHELEFVLVDAQTASASRRPWAAYGLSALLDHEAFIDDVLAACDHARLPVEQIHAEYGDGQFEVSFAPAEPLQAADRVVLGRLVIGRVARRHGLRASFSPQPFPTGVGNGAHVHLSLSRNGVPLLSGGTGRQELTAGGAHAVAGIVAALPDLVSVLAGSPVSGTRLQPGHWSGAFAGWGLENREAAVRLCAASESGESANVEVKCVDASANPYLATATLLGAALDGIDRAATLPAELAGNPADGGTGAVPCLPADPAQAAEALAASALVRRLLGAELHAALVSVRRQEGDVFGSVPAAEAIDRLRLAWST